MLQDDGQLWEEDPGITGAQTYTDASVMSVLHWPRRGLRLSEPLPTFVLL